tara:strand:- start:8087 stop:8764 length:678 start_codon:yes stop_codon:yes gene_type:complete
VKGVVADIINNKSSIERTPIKKFSVQNADNYVEALRKNYETCNVPFKKPDVIESVCRYPDIKAPDKHLDFVDKVYVKWTILKSGKVRLKIIPHFLILWDTYYSKCKAPPLKSVIAAYKAIGYSDAFIEQIHKNAKKRVEFAKKLTGIIEKIFDKSNTRRKVVKAKSVPIVQKEDVSPPEDDAPPPEDDEDDDDDAPEEDERLVDEEEEDADDTVTEDVGVDDFDE